MLTIGKRHVLDSQTYSKCVLKWGDGSVGLLGQGLHLARVEYARDEVDAGKEPCVKPGSNEKLCFHGKIECHGSIRQLVGPKPVMLAFYEQFGDVSKAESNTLRIETEDEAGVIRTFDVRRVVLVEIGASVEACGMTIVDSLVGQPGIQFMFHDELPTPFRLASVVKGGRVPMGDGADAPTIVEQKP